MNEQDPQMTHAMDQCMAIIRESMEAAPPRLARFYNNLIKEGFEKDQAFILTLECMKKTIIPGAGN
jgi:hypothetical protein